MAEWQKMTPEIREALESAKSAKCICGETPCICHNGWGVYETEGELLAAIDSEIAWERWRLHGSTTRQIDFGTVEWLYSQEELCVSEIAEELGMSEGKVERILRDLGHEIVF